MAAVALCRAGSEEEHDIQLKLHGEFSETAGSNGTDGPGGQPVRVLAPSLPPVHGGDLGPVTKTPWAFVSSEKWGR